MPVPTASFNLLSEGTAGLGRLRLQITGAVMGEVEVLNQNDAWLVYDRWMEDDRCYTEETEIQA